jgi:hypothetical protein
MLRLILILLMPLSLFCWGGDAMPIIKVDLDTNLFGTGAPIPIAIMLNNPEEREIRLLINYPTLNIEDVASFEVSVDGQKTEPWKDKLELFSADGTSGKIPIETISPKETLRFHVFLNRYVKELKSGPHKLSYTLTVAGADHKPLATVNGELKFSIEADQNSDNLHKDFERLTQTLRGSKFWERREAIEALVTSFRIEVIPYLGELAKAGYEEYALPALCRFKNQDNARAIIVSSLDSKRVEAVLCALDVAGAWRLDLAEAKINSLICSENKQIQIAAIRYVGNIGSIKYIEVVRNLIADEDPKVSSAAKEILKRLSTKAE